MRKAGGQEGMRGPARLGISSDSDSQRLNGPGERGQNAKQTKSRRGEDVPGSVVIREEQAARREDTQKRCFYKIKKTGPKHISQARKRHVLQTERVNRGANNEWQEGQPAGGHHFVVVMPFRRFMNSSRFEIQFGSR